MSFLSLIAQSNSFSSPPIRGLESANNSSAGIANLVQTILNFAIFLVVGLSVLWTIPGIIVAVVIYTRTKWKRKLMWALISGLIGPVALILSLVLYTVVTLVTNFTT